jgi:AcrR family transcriptional regulator
MSIQRKHSGTALTRKAILDAGRRVLLRKRAFSMAQVSTEAGVSRQALYLHFADRYALLEALVDGASAAAEGEATAATGEKALDQFLENRVKWCIEHGELEQAIRNIVAADPALAKRWAKRQSHNKMATQLVARLEKEGRLAKKLSAANAAVLLETFTSTHVIRPLLGSDENAEDVVTTLRAALKGSLLK